MFCMQVRPVYHRRVWISRVFLPVALDTELPWNDDLAVSIGNHGGTL